ncbi:hypothetical protein GCM10011519_19830 [Marmoricola endophyticus]|uniref:EamA domain-containing protein n=1 Tax=Marmoricola endophyticus TaxID=2040280 RepID=A0A917BIY9_9ACTN|nr:DMT family transporter [Marmoricola endophyticus]GGF46003.1 hypothetical protein GCM10011519_19830 [Marmoricola endophyticus]
MAQTSRGLPLLPAAGFVLVWSAGYIAGPYGVSAMAPLWLVACRFLLAAVLAAGLALVLKRPRTMDRRTALRVAASGFMLNAVQFGAIYLAFDSGLTGTLASLAHSLSPVLTALLAAVVFGERLSALQVVGFLIGVAGVVLVLGPDVGAVGGLAAVALMVLSVLGLSTGTLGQRWIGTSPDPLWSAALQFAVSGPPVLVLALLVEGTHDIVSDPAAAGISLVYIAVVNSIVGLFLLGVLVRARGAGAAASVFFLMPPVTALLSWLVLHETLNARELAGLVVTVVGVAAATRTRRGGRGVTSEELDALR